jgi:hypothetical protein
MGYAWSMGPFIVWPHGATPEEEAELLAASEPPVGTHYFCEFRWYADGRQEFRCSRCDAIESPASRETPCPTQAE